jgi:acyl carrier protein
MEKELRDKVFAIIEKDIPDTIADIDPDAELRTQLSVDSMLFVRVLARLEAELGIEIPMSAMESKTLNEFLGILERQIQQAA